MSLIHTQIFIYLYSDICTYTSMNLHTYCQHTHTYVCICMIMYIYIYTFNQYARTHTWRHEYMHMPRNMLILIFAHTHTCVYSQRHAHKHIHRDMCAHVCTHICPTKRHAHLQIHMHILYYSYTLRHIHNSIYIHIWYAHIQTFLHTETCVCSSIFTHIFAHLLRYYLYLHTHAPFPILLVLLFSELLLHSPPFLSFSVLSLRRTLLQGDQMPQFAQIKSEVHPIFWNWCWDCSFISQWYPGVCDGLGWPPVGRPWC